MKLSKRAERLADGSIVIDEGDGYKVMAYKFEKPVNNRPIWQRLSEKQKQQATKLKDTSVSDLFGNPFTFVIISFMHPNYGYFADAGFFWKSMHRDWGFVPVIDWMDKYSIEMEESEDVRKSPIIKGLSIIADKEIDNILPTNVNTFLKDYPEFRELFK